MCLQWLRIELIDGKTVLSSWKSQVSSYITVSPLLPFAECVYSRSYKCPSFMWTIEERNKEQVKEQFLRFGIWRLTKEFFVIFLTEFVVWMETDNIWSISWSSHSCVYQQSHFLLHASKNTNKTCNAFMLSSLILVHFAFPWPRCDPGRHLPAFFFFFYHTLSLGLYGLLQLNQWMFCVL